jgi:hypothetical protein
MTDVVSLGDSSPDDFAAGRHDQTHLSALADGGVTLAPALAAEFSSSGLPAGWSVWPWAAGGTAEVRDGALVVDGARCGTEALFPSGRSVEFMASFSGAADQHVGLGTDFASVPWIMFSTGHGGGLHARSNFYRPEETRLAGDLLESRHRFRIDWNVLDIIYSVDGAVVATQMVPIVGFMRPIASDGRVGDGEVRVEWLRMTPYLPSGTFTSRVFDAGQQVSWASAAWQAAVPAGTALRLSIRTGGSPAPGPGVPDGWSPWTVVAASGAPLDAAGRYVQYQAELSSNVPARTPVLREVTLRHHAD